MSRFCARYDLWLMLMFAATYIGPSSANANFTVSSTSYNCSTNVICLGSAHVNTTRYYNSKIEPGMLSLNLEGGDGSQTSGIVYYKSPVRLLDPSSNRAASFNTSFVIDDVWDGGGPADGMAFVISADGSQTGNCGQTFGFFDAAGTTDFKSIVVEFDTIKDVGPPCYDISPNHVSFDFSNITTNSTADSPDVQFGNPPSNFVTVYAWVEFSSETQILQVRVSQNNSRPSSPLLEQSVNLFDLVDEYMWVGFSCGGSSSGWSNYYIGDWSFESYGIPPGTVPLNPGPGFVVGLSVGVPALLLACICIVIILQRKYFKPSWSVLVKEDTTMIELDGTLVRFSYEQLSAATASFSEEAKLGQGGFGSVYRGVLASSGIPVAVKKIHTESNGQGEKEFMAEVSIISQLSHRHLIQLLGWCKDAGREKYLLVYELMPNGSLDKVLFPGAAEPEKPCLPWQQRFNILTGTAAALDYLHRGWKQQVVHRDIKCSNIMLDEKWNAKLGDFGLARLVDHERTAAATTLVAGTFGYMAPEVFSSGRFTDKSDVFAFGVVVLEIACGRKVLLPHADTTEMNLVNWVWHNMREGNLLRIVDNRLDDYDPYWMEVVLTVGLLCSHLDPLARPSMGQVVQVLAGDVPVPSIPMSGHTPGTLTTKSNSQAQFGSTEKSSSSTSIDNYIEDPLRTSQKSTRSSSTTISTSTTSWNQPG